MKRNMGTLDRIIRFALAAVFLYLYAKSFAYYAEGDITSNIWSLMLFALGCLLIITSVVGFCPVYAPFGLCSTKKASQESC